MGFSNGWRRPALFLIIFSLLCTATGCVEPDQETDSEPSQPNIIILFADDLGYGDLSSYGHPTIRTPNIDRIGEEGVRFTSFVTGAWCVPSRTQLLTGRYMTRVEFGGGTGSDGTGGLPDSELTLAESLNQAGYATGMVGKWHLGYMQDKFLPPNQGFDSWFGLPYSNDYRKPWVQTEEPLGLYRGTEMVEHPINQDSITVRYTEEAVRFITSNSGDEHPFFLYLAYAMPHLPIHTTEQFRGSSDAGLYGDVIETIDWSVGQVMETLEQQGISENTIVFFASDNGPWLNLPDRMLQEGNKPWHQGTTGLLRESKATTYEGGTRVPALIRWPAQVPAGQVTDDLAASPDIYRTLIETAGGTLPDHPIDGYNLMPFLTGEEESSPRNEYFYLLGDRLEAMRKGKWKLRTVEEQPQLFDLQNDPGERFNRAGDFPEVVEELQQDMVNKGKELGIDYPLNPEE
ncbi:MAG: sulfatase [Balneolaceae bacterium]|nr:sulfatase [Balneolaceae bacterium]